MSQVDKRFISVVLAGGSGLRLWPVSTREIPKQFISLGKQGTLLQETLRRVILINDVCKSQGYSVCEPLLIMHESHKLPSELSIYEPNIVYEQHSNDTAIAIARSVMEVRKRYGDDVAMLILPADHYIYNVDRFVEDIARGINCLTKDKIVLFGIEPTGPESKYGYIIPTDAGVKFKEKPNVQLALELIEQKALWNSGIFLANNELLLSCLTKSSHNIMDWVLNPREGKAASFDIAVLQEYPNIYPIHCSDWKFSDLGTFESFTDIPEIKNEMNHDMTIVNNCSNVNILNRGHGHIVVIGCKDLFVILNDSNLLIMSTIGDHNNSLKEIAGKIGK